MMLAQSEAVDILSEWRDAEIDDDEIYKCEFSDDMAEDFVDELGLSEFDDLSEVAKYKLISGVGSISATYISAKMGGANTVAAVAVCNYENSYSAEYDISNQIWIYGTDVDGHNVIVSLTTPVTEPFSCTADLYTAMRLQR